MKFAAVILAVATCTSAFAFATLVKEWRDGSNHFCKYSNGAIITVKLHELCPLNIN